MSAPRPKVSRAAAPRALAFAALLLVTACALFASAQPRKPGAKPAPAAEGGAPAARESDAGTTKGTTSVTETKTADGGAKVFRFGEVEVEGRLKSPQIVYFLRRVRAEFAAGDLGHRSFVRELDETKNEPSF